jgi:2-(1,2-epoxy-1,2-dihydrophenyl)acetyl-CoA isomerase
MSYQHLTYSVTAGVGVLALNRPTVYNALNEGITFEMQDALKTIARDESRVIVLTGEGKAFCSGQDLKAVSGDEKRPFIEILHKRYNPIVRAIRELPKPVICRLNGVAAGAGCSLALACDMIVASEDASLIEVFINVGLVPDSGSSWFLPRRVSQSKAFELCTMGSKLSAKDAYELGIVNKVVPHAELDAAVKTYTDYFATAPTRAIGLIKKMLQKSATASLDEMLDYEAYCQEIAGNSLDYQEGLKAFLEKRKPAFTGK